MFERFLRLFSPKPNPEKTPERVQYIINNFGGVKNLVKYFEQLKQEATPYNPDPKANDLDTPEVE